MFENLYEKLAATPIPEGVDDTVREFKELPYKTWILGIVPPSPDPKKPSTVVEDADLDDGRVISKVRVQLRPIGGEEKFDQKDGPWASLFDRISLYAWDEKLAAPDETTLNPRLIGLMNAVISPAFPKGSAERWANTLSQLKAHTEKLNPDPSRFNNEIRMLAYVFVDWMNTYRPTLLFTVRGRNWESEDKTRKGVRPVLGSFEGDTPKTREEYKVLQWETGENLPVPF